MEAPHMLEQVARHWWVFLIRGLAAIAFGVIALVWPAVTLLVLIALFGAYAIVDGLFNIVGAFTQREQGFRWSLLFWGAVSVAAGVIAFVWPGLTALVLLYVIAAWAVVTGALEVIAAIAFRRYIEGEWLLALAGLLSIGVGIALFVFPGAGLLSLVWLIGAYAIGFGILLAVLSLRIRGWRAEPAGTWRPAQHGV